MFGSRALFPVATPKRSRDTSSNRRSVIGALMITRARLRAAWGSLAADRRLGAECCAAEQRLRRDVFLCGAVCLGSIAFSQLSAQTSPDAPRFTVEARFGQVVAAGGARELLGVTETLGATVTTRAGKTVLPWLSWDYRPAARSFAFDGPAGLPRLGTNVLTVGVARPLSLPLTSRFRIPILIGVGAGATRVRVEFAGEQRSPLPAGARFAAGDEDLWQQQDWRPTAAARLSATVPLFWRIGVDVSAAAQVTNLGSFALWNGEFEPRSGGDLRPGVRQWRYGTAVTIPVTAGIGVRF